jgi:5'-nucleotidase
VLRRYLEGLVGGNGIRYHLSGVRVEFDPSAPAGSRLRRVTMSDGKALDDRRTYRVVMTNFLAESGDGVTIPPGQRVEELGLVDVEALVAYLRARPGGRLVLSESERAPRIIRRVP